MNLINGFLTQCEKTPNQFAFYEEQRQLSYLQFKQQAIYLAYAIRQQRHTQQPIAILLERGIDAAIAIYAVLMTGACYLPLDVKNPTSRLQLIIEDAQPELIIGKGDRPAWLNDRVGWASCSAHQDNSDLAERWAEQLIHPTNNEIAAILYTSGSTGTPKGVALSHAAMLNFSNWAAQTFNLTAQDRIASLAPFHFDLSVFDLFSSLSCGATVFFIPSQLTLSPSKLTAWLAEQKITCWYTVPSLLSFIAFKGGLETRLLPELKQLLFAGEVFPTPHLIRLAQLLPDTNLYNLYGPTETNVCCYWPVNREKLTPEQAIPIGIPACDAKLQIAENGELLVHCENNFSGYWQQGQLIARNSSEPYRTGDKVSRNQEGEYCYHGRLDRMLKCSGYRVEPAEIETVLNQIPGIEASAVIGVQDVSSGQRPAAVLVMKNQALLADIIKTAKEKLPTYMLPSKFKIVSTLPILSNGKINYSALYSLFNSYD
jgi:amino acid adenylation domain-containing protein